MKNKEQLQLALDSICIYKNLFNEGVGKYLTEMVDNLNNKEEFGKVERAYNDLVYALFSKSENLSLREYFIKEMLLDHNPFNVTLENKGEVPLFIMDGLKNELKQLNSIINLNSKEVKAILMQEYGDNKKIAKQIDSLIDWGVSKATYKAINNTQFEKLREELIKSENIADYLEEIKDFHKEHGTGRAPAFSAFIWERFENEEEGHLREVLEPDPIRLSELVGYEEQKKEIIENTENFLNGIPANNLLLYGSRGTGKSSTVKAILNEYYTQDLRLIEVDKEQLSDFTRIIRLLKHKKQKFIIFVDDLVFSENEASYSALKTILEGRVENRPNNILIYATTNRRHLVQEKFSDRDDVYAHDTKEEQLSLADRFGITISFFAPNQKEFLNIVDGIVKTRGLEVDEQYLHSEALKWEKWHNGRSPRSAKQFINWLEGELQRKSEDK